MRKNRLLRLILAATLMAAVSVLSFAPNGGEPDSVDWTNADETNPISPPDTATPDYDGDGTPDAQDSDADGDGVPDDGSTGSAPEGGGDADEPEVNEPGSGEESRSDAGGMLGLSFPLQAGLSVGVIALAFLALLPGRRMPANLR
ncbi:hypothetical protein [Glycomyces salinus]|uniref:hypothetical protein n=1 Tax=Glycomyces salinus TaxID=980294 RepID=UPI0018EDE0EC|nr:hypothetical protein [Glycomyces salinus]